MKRMKGTAQTVVENCPVVRIEAEKALIPYFRPIFQAGFLFRCQVGTKHRGLSFPAVVVGKGLRGKKDKYGFS